MSFVYHQLNKESYSQFRTRGLLRKCETARFSTPQLDQIVLSQQFSLVTSQLSWMNRASVQAKSSLSLRAPVILGCSAASAQWFNSVVQSSDFEIIKTKKTQWKTSKIEKCWKNQSSIVYESEIFWTPSGIWLWIYKRLINYQKSDFMYSYVLLI